MGLFKGNKFYWIKQHDSMQCGVACLAMICRHYRKEYSLEYLDGFCHANIAGVSMLGIADGARSVGFETMTAAASTDELKKSRYRAFSIGTRIILWFFMAYPGTANATGLPTQEKD